MPDFHPLENEFLKRITEIVLENLSDEQFGVSELAREMGMSRSNLLRKIKKLTKLSVSQFIREVRLKQAMEMLRQNSHTVSEVSYNVGFGSISYFIKCFHDFYGYPPGEAGKRDLIESDSNQIGKTGKKRNTAVIVSAIVLVILSTVLFGVFKPVSFLINKPEKSIAVLPFKNDSNDSTNVYLINGLMESILTNLQEIEDLRVISRTSVEKYRNSKTTIPEIAGKLNVNYIVEGSGQKIGDKILLNIQLIEARTDKHLLAEQFSRETKDIFNLQMEVAKKIAEEIEALITPEEESRINAIPTDDLVAYDYFLKGIDLLNKPGRDFKDDAIQYFEIAIEHDGEFARAYAAVAIAYFLLDENQVEKKYSDSINYYADKALLLDSQLPQGLIAKALFYMIHEEYELAVPYFEKALEYNPNLDLAFVFLVDIYVNHLPDTEKYLEYALRGNKIDYAAYDSTTASYSYLHISNAFIQSGFINEAEKYINRSLEYNPKNLFSEYVKAYILYAKNRKLQQTKSLLIEALNKDTTRLDIIQEVGKICYYLKDYKSAYYYYRKFTEIRDARNLDIYRSENAKIGVVLSKMGLKEASEKYFRMFRDYADNDPSIYKHINLAMYYSFMGDTEKAIKHLELFSEQDNYHYWTVIFLKMDPLVDNIKDLPEFGKIYKKIETRFRKYHERIKASLKEKNLV